MRIGINGYEAVVPRFGYDRKTGLPNRVGSGEFAFQLLEALYREDKKNKYIIYSPVMPSVDMPKETSFWGYRVVKGRTLWTMTSLSKKLFTDRGKIDVFFSPTHYLPFFTFCPSVITILDLSYIHFPQLFKKKDLYQLKYWGGRSIKQASKVITISQSSKNDIIKYYGVPGSKVEVVYPGIKEMNKKTSEYVRLKYKIEGDYILFVGTLQPRKNVTKLIEAFSNISISKYPNISLVIVGKKGWLYEDILSAPSKFKVEDRVKFLDFVPDSDLPSLYKNAVCFVLPSLYEGFGLPVLEAMQHGCPVITSSVSSLPEAGGDAALYVDPENSMDIAEKIELVIKDKTLREKMIEKGYEQVKKFSWDKSAKKTLQVLEEVAKNE